MKKKLKGETQKNCGQLKQKLKQHSNKPNDPNEQ